MASLKRYRQTSDSNAAARFRDLPPRFKRQKSITETYSSDSHIQCQTHKPKKMSQGNLLISDKSKTTNNLNIDQVKESDTSDSFKDRKISKKGTVYRPHLIVDQNYTKRSTQPVVLSPMDNNLFNFTRSDEQEYSAVDTMNSFSWQNQQLPWTQFPCNQTNISQVDTLPYRETWSPASNRPIHQTEESPHKTLGQSPTLSTSKPETATQPFKDYSETDKRIIEMFKELERVADQKEKEENENGTDRKSLVSHHLRMLMCAIDKYTEGIDDDDEDLGGRNDEAPAEEKSLSRPTSPTIGETSVPSKFSPPSQQFVQLPCTNISSVDGVQSVPSLYVHSPQTAHIPIMRNILHQQIPCVASPFSEEKLPECSSKMRPPFHLSSGDIQPWDLWSSPSFNVLDVYSNLSKGHNSSETADSTFALFNQLGMENDYCPRAEEGLTRTPLYKR